MQQPSFEDGRRPLLEVVPPQPDGARSPFLRDEFIKRIFRPNSEPVIGLYPSHKLSLSQMGSRAIGCDPAISQELRGGGGL